MNEEDLRKFIEFTKTLLTQLQGQNEYAWFFESFNLEIVNSFFQNGNNQLVSFYNDIKRTRYFLKHIDKNDWLEGFKYFENIIIPELKMELIKDFKEMKIADRTNDIIEYTRRLVMQLENCLNTVIEIENAHEKIVSNPTQYQDN